MDQLFAKTPAVGENESGAVALYDSFELLDIRYPERVLLLVIRSFSRTPDPDVIRFLFERSDDPHRPGRETAGFLESVSSDELGDRLKRADRCGEGNPLKFACEGTMRSTAVIR